MIGLGFGEDKTSLLHSDVNNLNLANFYFLHILKIQKFFKNNHK
jgi:hypothetical protein